jgi:hypothetical protein
MAVLALFSCRNLERAGMTHTKNHNNGLREGARVEIVRDSYGQVDRRISLVGLTGTIRRASQTATLNWDVELDFPLRDGRKFLWCSTWELHEVR